MKRLITQMLVVVALPVVALGQTGTGGAPARPALGDLLKLVPDEAALAAKLDLYNRAPAQVYLLETYHLFGDPAMALNLTIRPWPYSIYLPIVSKNHSGG